MSTHSLHTHSGPRTPSACCARGVKNTTSGAVCTIGEAVPPVVGQPAPLRRSRAWREAGAAPQLRIRGRIHHSCGLTLEKRPGSRGLHTHGATELMHLGFGPGRCAWLVDGRGGGRGHGKQGGAAAQSGATQSQLTGSVGAPTGDPPGIPRAGSPPSSAAIPHLSHAH